MSELILLMKRDYIDKQWQVAPYPIESRERGEKLVKWLRNGQFKKVPFEYRILSTELK